MEVININVALFSLIVTIVSATNFNSTQVIIPAEDDHAPPAIDGWMIHRSHHNSSTRILGDEKYNDPGCGPEGHNVHCADDLCCSRWGYCGSSKKYCGKGCQPKFGICHGGGGGGGGGPVQPPIGSHVPPPVRSHKPPPKRSHKPPPKPKHVPPPRPSHVPPPIESPPPCSCHESTTSLSAHTLGDDERYNRPSCGKEGHHGTCQDELCCSRYSFCGRTDKYCGDGCQHGYGKCGGGGGHHSPPPPDDESPPPSPCTCD